MRYRLRTLLIVLTLGPPMLAFMWLSRHWTAIAISLLPMAGLFAALYWMTLKSQAMDPRTRGGDKYNS